MIRSSSSARSVLRLPQSATAPQLGPTMFGAQPPYGVQIEFNAERLLGPRGNRSAALSRNHRACDPCTLQPA